MLDPWLVSQIIISSTTRLSPLVAVQPVYLHPYSVAKMVSSFAYLYRRRIYLNMVAGGFVNDLASLDDTTPHDRRYDRLVEYTTIIRKLCASEAAVTFDGDFYHVHNLKLTPPVPPDLMPGFLVSGSSEAGLMAAAATGAIAIKYPKPPSEDDGPGLHPDLETGVRIGIIARKTSTEAWQVAHERFPEDRKGQLTHQLAKKSSDSAWHEQLSKLPDSGESPYWLVPFQNYKSFCPYLVGSYECVAEEVSRYLGVGHTTFVLDIPPDAQELESIGRVFDLAKAQAVQ
jgi:alkanesulfonate monooxygenase